jgi:arginase family enzyme
VQPDATFLLGARDLDPPETALLAGSAITWMPTDQIPGRLPEVLARPSLKDALGYLHLDLDVLDPAGVVCRAAFAALDAILADRTASSMN